MKFKGEWLKPECTVIGMGGKLSFYQPLLSY